MTINIRLSARLRAARKAAGFKTSKAFLKKYNIPASTYSQHESGSRSPNDKMLEFYSNIFGVNSNWLKMGKGLPYKKSTTNQQQIMTEELADLRTTNQKISPLDQILLAKILEELLKLNQSGFPLKKVKSIAHQTINIYKKIISSDLSKKLQNKMLKNLLATYIS